MITRVILSTNYSKTHLFTLNVSWIINKPQSFLISTVTVHAEVMTRGSAAGHFTWALYEVVNLAPFVTSFSTRLMASWQLYSPHVLWVVMQRNYIGPNLMNQVNVPPALLTFLACDLPSLCVGQTEAFTLCAIQSNLGRKSKKEKKNAPLSKANQECTDF